MPIVWSRANAARQPRIEILKVGRVLGGARIWLAQPWLQLQQLRDILPMSVTYFKEISMKKFAFILFVIASVVSLPACNTVQGVGKDIERGGQAIEKSAK